MTFNALLKNPETSDVSPEELGKVLSPDDMMNLQKQVVSTTIAQQDLITASVTAGGPGSLNQAILQAIIICKTTLEKVSQKTNISKYRLTKMIEGEMEITPKALGKLMKVFHKIRPDLYPEN